MPPKQAICRPLRRLPERDAVARQRRWTLSRPALPGQERRYRQMRLRLLWVMLQTILR